MTFQRDDFKVWQSMKRKVCNIMGGPEKSIQRRTDDRIVFCNIGTWTFGIMAGQPTPALTYPPPEIKPH